MVELLAPDSDRKGPPNDNSREWRTGGGRGGGDGERKASKTTRNDTIKENAWREACHKRKEEVGTSTKRGRGQGKENAWRTSQPETRKESAWRERFHERKCMANMTTREKPEAGERQGMHGMVARISPRDRMLGSRTLKFESHNTQV